MSLIETKQDQLQFDENKQLIGSQTSDFTIIKELGRGSYGVVYRVFSNINKKEYVLKKISIKHLKSKH